MARTLQQQLDAVDTLIVEYETEPVEELSLRDRRMRRARLLELYQERRRLSQEVRAASDGQFGLAELSPD